jgi:ribosomal protein S12 methylthiotransferase accessory factor
LNTLVIVGEGILADTVCRYLSGFQLVRRPDLSEALPPAELVLVLQDQEDSSVNLKAEGLLQPRGTLWLCAYTSSGAGVVGPLVRPGKAGCSQCAEIRRSMAGRDREQISDLMMSLVVPDYIPPPPKKLSSAGYRHMAHILSAEAAKVLRREHTDLEGHVYLVDFNNLNTTIHYVLPDAVCPICGQLPDDTPEAAEISLRPCLKLSPHSYRCRSMSELQKVLCKDYWDSQTGLFNDKQLDLVSAFASAVTNLPLSMSDEVTGGRSHSYADSEQAAILEGLERYCGLTPRGKRTVVFDSYSHLKEHAMDPSRVGLHAKEQYEQPDFPFLPFDADSPMDWVWGYSFLEERSILVPELLAYYSLGYGGGYVYENSNGCAIGGSLEEAILHGILEVVERDSFLMTWYARLPVPRLDHYSSGDRELTMMIDRLQAVAGYEVRLYNTTTENKIPGIWALAMNGAEQGVKLVCSAGAHLDPVQAAKSALQELASTISMVEERWIKRGVEAEAMLDDSYLVQQMEDHALLYSLPQAADRLSFLLDEQRPLRTFAEEFHPVPGHNDLTDDLKQLLQVFRSLKLEVIVIDQSSSETLHNGLHCVKVLIPGMLPMTFGHHLSRLTGLDRMLDVPMKLGYADRRLTPDELNPYPHPFP